MEEDQFIPTDVELAQHFESACEIVVGYEDIDPDHGINAWGFQSEVNAYRKSAEYPGSNGSLHPSDGGFGEGSYAKPTPDGGVEIHNIGSSSCIKLKPSGIG